MDKKKKYEAGKARIHVRENYDSAAQFRKMEDRYKKNPGMPVLLTLIWNGVYFGVIIFLFNVWLGQQMASAKMLIVNLIMFGIYFITTFFFCHVVLKINAEKQQMEHEKQQAESLREYTHQIEVMYSDLRRFKHDYINILTSMSGYLDDKDYDGLQKYFMTEVLQTGRKMERENYRLNQLGNIKIPVLKGLLSSKLIYAHELGLDVVIDIMDEIDEINMQLLDLSRVMGIYLDNAIDAAGSCRHGRLTFSMVKGEDSVAIIVENTIEDINISLSKLGQNGYTTKGAGRGMGLYNVKEILSRYPHIAKETIIENGCFRQVLIIND